MYTIRRVYLDHVGYKDSWFGNVTLPFHDFATGEVRETLISLENGRGKTTLLSLIFCCFDPDQRRFVQHLQKPNHEFRDYFTDKPGLILIELESIKGQQKLEFENPDRLVTGQYVSVRSNEADRHFFGFTPFSGMRFEDVPAIGRGTVKGMEDVRAWLSDSLSTHRPHFFSTQHQNDWTDWLNSEGVDTWMISKQVNFCRTEGGIEKFMNFTSEKDFLKEFFYLVMNPDDSESVRQILSDALKKLEKRPENEKRRHLLTDLKTKLETFSSDAARYMTAKTALGEKEANANLLFHALSEDIQKKAERIVEREHDLSKLIHEKSELEARRDRERAVTESLLALKFRRMIADKQAELSEHTKTLADANENERTAKAALERQKLNRVNASIMAYEERIEKGHIEIRPARAARNAAGIAYKRKLEAVRKDKDAHATFLEAETDDIRGELDRLGSEKARKSGEKNELKEKIGRLNEKTDQRNRALESLVKAGLLGESESVGERIGELEQEMARTHATISEQKVQGNALEKEIQNTESAINASSVRVGRVESELEADEKRLQTGYQKMRALQSDSVLCRIMGDDAFDPASVELVSKLTSQIARIGNKATALRQELGELRGNIEFLDGAGSLLMDENTQNALTFLRENGLPQARFYPSYLAEALDNDIKGISRRIESDPGCYMGIMVHTEKELEKARILSRNIDTLIRPVAVSLATLDINDSRRTHVVLPPADSAIYSEHGAETKLLALKTELSQKKEKLGELEADLERITAIAHARQLFADEYGEGGLDRMADACAEKRAVLASEKAGRLELEERKQDAADRLRRHGERLEALAAELSETKERRHKLELFYQEHEARFASDMEKKKTLESEIVEIDTELKENDRMAKEKQEAAAVAIREIERVKAEIDAYRQKISAIGVQGKAPAKIDLSPPETLFEQKYEDCCAIYDAALAKSDLSRITDRLDDLKKQQAEAAARVDKISDGLDTGRIDILAESEESEIVRLKAFHRAEAETVQKQLGAIGEKISRLETEYRAFGLRKSFVAEPNEADIDQDDVTLEEIEARILESEVRVEGIDVSLEKETAREAAMNETIRELRDFKEKTTLLRKIISEYADADANTVPEADLPILPASRDELVEVVGQCKDDVDRHRRRHDDHRKIAEKSHQAVLDTVLEETFMKTENRIAVRLKSAFELACSHAGRHLKLTSDRIDSLTHDIESTEEDLRMCVDRLANHTDAALAKLRQAVKNAVIPTDVPEHGGKKILKMKTDVFSVSKEQRRSQFENYVKRLAENGRVPGVGGDTGDELSAEAVSAVAKAKNGSGDVGIEILKLSRSLSYTTVKEIKGSEGQRMTSALLLYLVMAQLRAETRLGMKKAPGGFLLLDNPMGKSNALPLVKAQVELAKELGFQLIYATGIKDYNAQSPFSHFIQLRAVASDKINDRTHVNIADVEIECGEFTTYVR